MRKLYPQIFRRKSFHLFRCQTYPLDKEELSDIYEAYKTLTPLYPEIKTAIRIVEADKTNCSRGEEYCIELFSEKKENYLMNIGYIGEQLDLYLVSHNIATLWFGIGKEEETYEGLDYVIMIAIAKVDDTSFRKDMYKSKRKTLSEIWKGDEYPFSEILRFAPSACNTQPWHVEARDNKLTICRYRKEGKRGIMPRDKVLYYNRIDIGIFLLFLDLCLAKDGIGYERTLYPDDTDEEFNKVAEYKLI